MASDISRLLHAWKRGDREAAEKLAVALYNELRRIARKHMRQERAGHTLQTSSRRTPAPSILVCCEGLSGSPRRLTISCIPTLFNVFLLL